MYSQTLQQKTYRFVYLFLFSFISNKYNCTHFFYKLLHKYEGVGGGGLRTQASVYQAGSLKIFLEGSGVLNR